MAVERTLSIIKPDAVAKNVVGEIYSRFEKNGLKVIGIASGEFSPKTVLARFKKQKVTGEKYKSSRIFPLSGTQMTFLDDWTMLFGDSAAIRAALDARNGAGLVHNVIDDQLAIALMILLNGIALGN